MYIRIADLNIEVKANYGFVEYFCQNYLINKPDSIDFVVGASDDEIKDELLHYENPDEFPLWYGECLSVYRKITHELYKFDAFLLHGVSFEYKNNAYLLCAKSGTGKTTHANLLKDYLKDEFKWINGDKPIIRFINGVPYAYGTPWCGKEFYHNNIKAKCKALGFINRSETNYVKEVTKNEAFKFLSHQILLNDEEEALSKQMELFDKFIKYIDIYNIYCNMDPEAAKVTYENILNKKAID